MKINSINTTPKQHHFTGAYILKGTGKSLRKFQEEMALQSFVNPRFTNAITYNLTTVHSDSQPYAEILVCTGEHIQNLRKKMMIDNIMQENKLRKFANDFHSWSEEKKQKWREGIQEAVRRIQENEVDNSVPGEKALENGNSDTFLNWYSATIKASNEMYNGISNLGDLPFPAKIRRLDADKVADALIANNFNIKEGFFRNHKNPPKVEIDDDAGVTMRFVNGKLDSVINYHIIDNPNFPEALKALDSYSKFKTDKNGKLIKTGVFRFGFVKDV